MTWRGKTVALTLSALLVSGIAAWGLVARPIMLRGEQVKNCADLSIYREAVASYVRMKGGYPSSLKEAIAVTTPQLTTIPRFAAARDAWEHELVYRTDGKSCIIVSLGRDGRSDGIDFWALRESRVTDWRVEQERCRDLNADTMVTDAGGESRCCGK